VAAAAKFKEDTATAAEVAPMFAATQAFEEAILADRSVEHARLVAQRQQEAFNRKVGWFKRELPNIRSSNVRADVRRLRVFFSLRSVFAHATRTPQEVTICTHVA